MIAFISSSVILENPVRPAQVGHDRPAWISSIGPFRNARATMALASLAICRRSKSAHGRGPREVILAHTERLHTGISDFARRPGWRSKRETELKVPNGSGLPRRYSSSLPEEHGFIRPRPPPDRRRATGQPCF